MSGIVGWSLLLVSQFAPPATDGRDVVRWVTSRPADVVLISGSGQEIVVPSGATSFSAPENLERGAIECRPKSYWCYVESSTKAPRRLRLSIFHAALVVGHIPVTAPVTVEILGHLPITDFKWSGRSRADAGGRFEFAAPAGDNDLRFQVSGFAPLYLSRQALDPKRESRLGVLPLQFGSSLVGRVRDAKTGLGIGGAEVQIELAGAMPVVGGRTLRDVFRVSSDVSGLFQATGLEPGQYWLTIRSRNHAPREESAAVLPGVETFLDDTWLSSYFSHTFSVSPSQHPAGHSWRMAMRSTAAAAKGKGWSEFSFGPEGKLDVERLAPGAYEVRLLAGSSEFHHQVLDLTSEETVATELRPRLLKVVGEVRGKRRPDSTARVVLVGLGGGGPSVEFELDETGRFEGWFGGGFSKWNTARIEGDPAISPALDFDVEVLSEGESEVTVSVDLGSLETVVRVLTADRIPVKDAVVQLLRENSPRNAQGKTGDDGTARLGFLAKGRYELLARHPELGQSALQRVDIQGDQSFEVKLEGYLETTVEVATEAGSPVPFADVYFFRTTDGPYSQSRTDGAGRAKLRVAPDGHPGVLTVLAPAHVAWSACVQPKPVVSVSLPLGPVGRIEIEDGDSPLESGPPFLTTPQGGVLFGTTLAQWGSRTDPANRNVMGNLPPGPYGLSRSKLGYGPIVRAVCSGAFKPEVSGFLYPGEGLKLKLPAAK